RALKEFGQPERPVGAHCPGYIAATDEQARAEAWPHYAAMHDRIGRERGWGPLSRAQFEAMAGPEGALFIGSAGSGTAQIIPVVPGPVPFPLDLKDTPRTLPP